MEMNKKTMEEFNQVTADNEYYPLPQPDDIPLKEKEDAMGAYLMMFAALAAGLPLPVINLIASVIYYFIHRTNSLFVRFHTLQALQSSLITSLLNAGAVFWTLRIFLFSYSEVNDVYKGFIAMVILVNIVYIIVNIYAAIQARKGRFFYMTFFGRYAYHRTFLIKNIDKSENNNVNMPPKM